MKSNLKVLTATHVKQSRQHETCRLIHNYLNKHSIYEIFQLHSPCRRISLTRWAQSSSVTSNLESFQGDLNFESTARGSGMRPQSISICYWLELIVLETIKRSLDASFPLQFGGAKRNQLQRGPRRNSNHSPQPRTTFHLPQHAPWHSLLPLNLFNPKNCFPVEVNDVFMRQKEGNFVELLEAFDNDVE